MRDLTNPEQLQLSIFKRFYEQTKEKIRQHIERYNQDLLEGNNPLLQSAVEQFAAIGASGKAKFIRGSLVALGYKITQAPGASFDHSLALAAAYELFETSILVHDDVFDQAGLRRDVPTVHEALRKQYLAGHEDQSELLAFNARSIAVCMGDLGFYFLNQVILDAYWHDPHLNRVLRYFNGAVMKTIKGEMLDLALPLEERLGISHEGRLTDFVLEIDELKTAAYTTAGPLCLGLILGGAEQSGIEKFEELLRCLGIAFQIQDDWLNLYGSPEQGKPLGSDIAEFKMTLFYAEACKDDAVKQELLRYYGKDGLSPEDTAAVRAIFEKSGAREKAEKTMAGYFEKSRALLRDIPFNNQEDKDILFGFILFLESRSR
jgi:geranylgeranyl diphosphate synthase type I